MATLIRCTRHKEQVPLYINLDNVETFAKMPSGTGTIVSLRSGSDVSVEETPEKVAELWQECLIKHQPGYGIGRGGEAL